MFSGLTEKLFGTPKEKRTQLYFRDDGKATFRKLCVEDASMVEKDSNGKIIKGWKHFYKLQFLFEGFKSLSADMVTLAFDRHYVLDPFNLLNKEERPAMDSNLDSPSIMQIAKSRCYKIDTTTKGGQYTNAIILFCGSGTIIEILIMGYLKAKGMA